MATKSLLARMRTQIRPALMWVHRWYLNNIWGMSIGEGTAVSFSAKLDRTNPRGVVIGKHTAIVFESVILTHDFVNLRHSTTTIGDYCLIGARAIIYPGVTIGDHVIISAASVVMKDVPSNSIAAGNPARVVEKDVVTGKRGFRIQTAA